ncbi:DUF2254 family protein [Nocardia seriolae]|uniref:DUF2254 domain-containing protein n=1 Tax=Nocardia seriolae TaxID=37332 RepID=A0ABC9Z3A1_9NOCA|nr:DUF2254 family protein [Nocardia seriolae]GEM28121.1 hypothetical protein NS2_63600 [Nocardia seriolae NBRC 15557]BAW08924.1 conserved hypothetical protein [Nocardia seriolae]BEK86235.1 hypothetical protein NSERKGN1266_21860 [Nocardia seriolae]BEK97832.1 hypothetical protein NSER024013_57380 [Nocardia seriolae]GAM50386.1 hypothetical protein NS07_v2contig00150-0015 [Nocardia seriolae]
MSGILLESDRRREALRTNLWFVPTVEVLAAVALFVGTYLLDRAVYRGAFEVPSWVIGGTPDSARQVLTAIAAAIMTVVGVVFSITIVALTLASTQFGPRMLRLFIRDRGTQITPQPGRVRAGHRGAGELRAAGAAGVREDPPGRARQPGGHDPAARRTRPDRQPHR